MTGSLAAFEIADAAQTLEFQLLVLAFLVMAGPILAERLRVPGLVGLIFLGVLFGPHVLGTVLTDGLVGVVGSIGLLYLMFLAGLELDINTFVANRTASITFGLLTFAVPFSLGLWVGLSGLEFGLAAAALIGAMWASHTLVAYPVVKGAGLEVNRAVGASVSATVITDVIALVILGFAAAPDGSETADTVSHVGLFPVWAGVLVVAGFCLWALPRATSWFFVHVGQTRVQRFVWILAGMAAGAFVALLGGIEGLVGAFLAGIGMNRLVPARSQLMVRVEFFGSALFVPAFLVSVGLSIDPAALTEPATIGLALTFAAVVVGGKIVAATAAGLIFEFSWPEIGMMSSLTIGQAAATLAIAQVGVSNGIFGQDILNAAVLGVVITVFVTSLGARYFARRLEPPARDAASIGSHVLLWVPERGDLDGVVEVGAAIAHEDRGLLTPFVVCQDGACDHLTRRLEHAVEEAIDQGQDTEGITRIAGTTVDGALNLAAESVASLMLLTWSGPRFAGNMLFGHDIDEIGERCPVPAIAASVVGTSWSRVVFLQGRLRGLRVRSEDAKLAFEVAERIARHRELELVVYATDPDDLAEPDEIELLNLYSGRGTSGLGDVVPGDMVVVPAHVADGAFGLGGLRLTRRVNQASLIVVAGPRRLHVTTRPYSDPVFGGAALNRGGRETLASTWEGVA